MSYAARDRGIKACPAVFVLFPRLRVPPPMRGIVPHEAGTRGWAGCGLFQRRGFVPVLLFPRGTHREVLHLPDEPFRRLADQTVMHFAVIVRWLRGPELLMQFG